MSCEHHLCFLINTISYDHIIRILMIYYTYGIEDANLPVTGRFGICP